VAQPLTSASGALLHLLPASSEEVCRPSRKSMFPTFHGGGGPAGADPSAGMPTEGHGGGPFHRMEAEEERQLGGTIEWASDNAPAPPATPFAAPTPASQAEGYLASILSFAADAKLGAQVARVRLGLDAKVRQAWESQWLSRFAGSSSGSGFSAAQDEAGIQTLIQQSRDAQEHLKVILGALEDYQRHRKGLADAAHRLGLALQEAGMRSPGQYGEALRSCGVAHQQAAACRMEAHAAEELHVLSKLRAHDGKAAADCRRSVRKFEAAVQELRVLQKARLEAQSAKQMANGDSPLTPTVEADAARFEETWVQRVQSAGEAVRGKLSMFEAKHAADYAASVVSHFSSVATEESRISQAFADIATSLDPIRRSAATVQLVNT